MTIRVIGRHGTTVVTVDEHGRNDMDDAQQYRPGEVCPYCKSGRLYIQTRRVWDEDAGYRTALVCPQCRRDAGEPTAADYAEWRKR